MKLNKDFRLNEVSGDYMLVRTKGRRTDMTSVFSLNEPAAWLYGRIGDSSFDEAVLVEWLTGEFDVDDETARRDVASLVSDWKSYGIISDDE